MFKDDFEYTLLGAAALIGLPVALIVAGTMAFANVDIKMPSFAKADPLDNAIECYNEIIDTNNQTECGLEIVEYIKANEQEFKDPAYKESIKAKALDKGLDEQQLTKMGMVIAFNGMCSDKGMSMIAESAGKPKDQAEQFGMDLGMGILQGLCTGAFEKNLSKLEKIG